ncbi:hypothetical protein [Gordonia malaquae]|uniref:hypothetical protein n=1 Tax=Gordonia malaquae TaxID=410332 RepID=UPI00301B5FEE
MAADATNDDARSNRVSGVETSWILQCLIDGEWKPYRGLFIADIADADPIVASAKADDRPDITGWRAYDVATDSVLATY